MCLTAGECVCLQPITAHKTEVVLAALVRVGGGSRVLILIIFTFNLSTD